MRHACFLPTHVVLGLVLVLHASKRGARPRRSGCVMRVSITDPKAPRAPSSITATRAPKPPVSRRSRRRRGLANRAGDCRFSGLSTGRGRRAAIPHRGEGRLRRHEPLCLRPGVRSASRQHRRAARASRCPDALRPDHRLCRLVSRPPQRLRVCSESGRREDRVCQLQGWQRGYFVGRNLGRCHPDRFTRLDGGVQDSAVAAPVHAIGEQYLRLHDRADGGTHQ